jgi:hypothetical protein
MTTQENSWRKLCLLVAEEKDPDRLSELVEQLIASLDEVRLDLEKRETQFRPNASRSPEDEFTQ